MSIKSSNGSASAERRRSSVSGGQRRLQEAPSTPGRPLFNFSIGTYSRKSIPSKWEDAEKWLISSSCHESPAHVAKSSDPAAKFSRQNRGFHQKGENFEERTRVSEENPAASFHGHVMSQKNSILAFHGVPSEVFLKGFPSLELAL